jgi:hypothetical protein
VVRRAWRALSAASLGRRFTRDFDHMISSGGLVVVARAIASNRSIT